MHCLHLPLSQHKQQRAVLYKPCCKSSSFLAILLQILAFNIKFQPPKRHTNNIRNLERAPTPA